MKLIGITGGIGAGKSEVTSILREFGFTVMDLDEIARSLVEPGSTGLAAIVDLFGAGYMNIDGTLDRKKLAVLVFNDKTELAKLDNMMGPLLWGEIERQRNDLEGDFVFVDGALLIEKAMHEKLDGIVLVAAPFSVRVQRAMSRDNTTLDEIKARIDAQMSDSEKRRYVDYVIDNDGTLHELRERVLSLVRILRQ